jgi:hypothetical protein
VVVVVAVLALQLTDTISDMLDERSQRPADR